MKGFDEFLTMNESALVKKSLVILRGVPGSGKSTFASLIAGGDDSIICCADDFFMEGGKYNWDRSKLGEAHKSCFEKCKALVEKSAPLVVVSNTNVRYRDFKEYEELGAAHGYTVFSIVVENRHGNNNVHNVPDDTVDQMRRKFDISL